MNTLVEHTSRFVRSRFLIFSLCALCVLCGELAAQEWKTLKDGIEYAEVRREISGKAVNINLLRLDLRKVRLDVHHAMDAVIGTEKTSSIAQRHGAFAAINAGFFRLDTSIWAGNAAGVLMIDTKLLSESRFDRTALSIANGTNRSFVRISPIRTFEFFRVGTKDIEISGINRELKEDEIVLFTPEFHRTTLTVGDVLEIAVEGNKVVFISDGKGSTPIMKTGYVVSASGAKKKELQGSIQIGAVVMLGSRFEAIPGLVLKPFPVEEPITDVDIVGGVPQLIKDGKIDITWEQEKSSKAFVETRHPRTAVAKLKDGKFLMLTADGRTEQSAGLDLYDLAAYLLELDATDAMNLDGGGSTTMFVDGKVVNHPSDKEGERKVSDAILVTARKSQPTKKK